MAQPIRWLFAGFVLSAQLIGARPTASAEQEAMEAGLIESFHGPAEEFVLRRGPQQVNVPVWPGGRLLSGDQLEVGTENGHITLWLFDPETHKKSVVVLSNVERQARW